MLADQTKLKNMKNLKNSKRNLKRPILKYLIELTIVAFGVFLGMMVSEYKSNSKIKENTTKSRSFIVSELETNIQILNRNIHYHEEIKKGFDSLRTNLSEEIAYSTYFANHQFRAEQIPGWAGIGITRLENIAFESAKIGGIIQNMDIDEVKQISSAYQILDVNQRFGENITQKLMGMNSESKVLDMIAVLELLTNDYLYNEKLLVNELNKTVEKLKK